MDAVTHLYIRLGIDPQPLPFEAYDANGRLWTDLADNEEGREATGWDRISPARPDDTVEQVAAWDADAEAWVMVDRPPVSEPEPRPATLGRLQFIVLAQTAGAMTDAMLVDAQENPAFKAFWIKFQMAQAVERDDPITRGSLDALAAGGYLPKGKAAVIAAWPTA